MSDMGGKRTFLHYTSTGIAEALTVSRSGAGEVKMVLDKNALFESTRALWPASIDLSEDPNVTNSIYQSNEKAFPVEDEWRQLAMWAFHQALGRLETWALAKGISRIHPNEITFAEFDRWMRSNLLDETWSAERAEYEESGAPGGG